VNLQPDVIFAWSGPAARAVQQCTPVIPIVFVGGGETGVGHSIHLRNEFVNSGVRAEHIDGNTLKDERDATLARLKSGEIELVTNCMVLTEGWDMPEVGCCILARPTRDVVPTAL
jgi:hypothetical protein